MINSFDFILVTNHLLEQGIENYTIREGNDCVWVTVGRIDSYYIIREGKIVDIITD